ncbi:MAG TPA: GNAT family N-acetyltransferase [Fibrobacteria bacterium]|nr:GNAT family N-acetyltransferase [Fibrobacteria bacterium]
MIRLYDPGLQRACREFLENSPQANYCHDPAWTAVIREAYEKETFQLIRTDPSTGEIRGTATACYLASAGFGKNLVCLPYLDYGGILAQDAETEDLLRDKLLAEALSRRAGLEIRSRDPLCGLPTPRDEKVSMILPLLEEEFLSAEGDWRGVPEGSFHGADGAAAAEAYWKGLDAKVRNQVRKAEKSGVTVKWGREDRLDEFFEVFCVNMRDLGSPTHARGFFAAVLRHFPGARIGTAHRLGKCIGGLFRIHWKDELVIPWASTLRDERIHCPNNALYWESIRSAFEEGCRRVDFGRSTRDEGTYRFKKQWQAKELPLYRYQFDEKGHFREQSWHISQGKLGWTRNVWAKLPLKVANYLGPMLRGSISA